MRTAELIAPLTFQLTDMPIEDPGPGEVQVRIEAVGVCGSDLHAYSEGAVGGTPNVNTMVLGQSTLEPFRTTAFNSMAATATILSHLSCLMSLSPASCTKLPLSLIHISVDGTQLTVDLIESRGHRAPIG